MVKLHDEFVLPSLSVLRAIVALMHRFGALYMGACGCGVKYVEIEKTGRIELRNKVNTSSTAGGGRTTFPVWNHRKYPSYYIPVGHHRGYNLAVYPLRTAFLFTQ